MGISEKKEPGASQQFPNKNETRFKIKQSWASQNKKSRKNHLCNNKQKMRRARHLSKNEKSWASQEKKVGEGGISAIFKLGES